ncbi:MAG: hypothetical protein CL484_03135 [Acidobacteria bacterium]|nr:hypothetical protein [Acidobacteriota bacterium]
MYTDVHRVYEAALANGGALYRLETKSAAHYFRTRAHYYRKLLRSEIERRQKSPATAETKYDSIKISIDKEDPCLLRFTIQGSILEGALTGADGKPIEAPESSPMSEISESPDLLQEVPDELEEFAKGLLLNAKQEPK